MRFSLGFGGWGEVCGGGGIRDHLGGVIRRQRMLLSSDV